MDFFWLTISIAIGFFIAEVLNFGFRFAMNYVLYKRMLKQQETMMNKLGMLRGAGSTQNLRSAFPFDEPPSSIN